MYCQVCKCRRYHYHTLAGEVWLFEHCYHEEPEVSEPVRTLATLFSMFVPQSGSA